MTHFIPRREDIARMFPRALPEWRDALGDLAPVLCEQYGLNRLEWCHFAGQIAAETNGMRLRRMEENMRFTTARRILEVYGFRLGVALRREKHVLFGQRFRSRAALAQFLVREPEKLARIVYGGRGGTPWMEGHRYIGRGPLQTTHLANYRAASEEVARQPGGGSYDLVANPSQLADDPVLGIRVAFAEWKLKGLGPWARRDDAWSVSKILNTGSRTTKIEPHGLKRRKRETARAKAIFVIPLEDYRPGSMPDDSDILDDDVWPCVGDGDQGNGASAEGKHPVSTRGSAGEPTLKRGDKDTVADGPIRRLQQRLRDLGYQVGDVDGDFGTLTHRAVVALQSEHDLVVDGRVGPRTWEVLQTTAPVDLGERETTTADDLAKRGSKQIGLWRRVKGLGGWLCGGSAALAGDHATGLGAAEAVVDQATRVKIVAAQGSEVLAWLMTPQMLIATVIAVVAVVLIACAQSGEADSVQKHRTGKDVSL